LSKLDWFKKTVVYPYLVYKNVYNLYGITYGLDDIECEKNTLHLIKDQCYDIDNFLKKNIYLSL